MCNAESSNEKQSIAVFFFWRSFISHELFFFVKIIKSLLPFPFFVLFFVPKKQKECKRSFLGKKTTQKRYFFPESKENAQVLPLFCFFEARSFPMSFFVLSKLTKVCCFFLFFVQKKQRKCTNSPLFFFFRVPKICCFFFCFFKNKIKMFLFYSSLFLCVSFVFTEWLGWNLFTCRSLFHTIRPPFCTRCSPCSTFNGSKGGISSWNEKINTRICWWQFFHFCLFFF